jgi:hypothetical protein
VVRETEEAMAAVAGAGPALAPPAHVKEALLRRAAAMAPVPGAARPAAPRAPWLRWAVGTAAAVVVGAAFTGAWVATRYEAQLGQMARQASALRERLRRDEGALREQVALYQSAIDLLRDPATQVITLGGLGPSPQASGRLIWHERAGGQLFVAKLPPAPPGQVYELWTIAGAAPRPAGVFQVDVAGAAVHRVAPLPEGPPVKVFAVTLEPAGGVEAPTGPMVLASK